MLEQPGMLEENFSHHWTTGRVPQPITLSNSFWKWLIGVRKKTTNNLRSEELIFNVLDHWGCNLLAFDREINVLLCKDDSPRELRDNYVSGQSGCHLSNIKKSQCLW